MARPKYLRLVDDWYLVVDVETGNEVTLALSINWRWRRLAVILGWLYLSIEKFARVIGEERTTRLRIIK